jgi:hypothetical protein
MILTHVDNFNVAGTCKFVDSVIEVLNTELKVSKVEKNKFRFMGVDIEKTANGIEISMEDYAKSMEKIEEIRIAKPDDPLTRPDLAVCRKYTGKLSWLASNTSPDLAFTALLMSKRNSCATIKDLKKINAVIDRIRAKPCKVVFSRIGDRKNLVFYGLSDASYKMDDQSVNWILPLLGNNTDEKAVPIFWKSKTIKNVCHLAKAAETRSVMMMMDNVQFFALQVEQLLFGTYKQRILIRMFTDSKTLLESAGSIHQVEEKMLRNCIRH